MNSAHAAVSRGVRSLPAILWVEEWPDDFLILHQGSNPTIEEMESWLNRYDLYARPTSQIVGATIFGTVTDRSTGLPLIGATVSISPMPIADGQCQAITDGDADRSSRARRQVLLRNGGSLRVDMQLDGRLCGPGSYGHLNGCRYLLLVEKVLECEEDDS